jgi:hypothetical protein
MLINGWKSSLWNGALPQHFFRSEAILGGWCWFSQGRVFAFYSSGGQGLGPKFQGVEIAPRWNKIQRTLDKTGSRVSFTISGKNDRVTIYLTG